MRRPAILLAAMVAAMLVVPAAAGAGPSEDYLEVYDAYKVSGTIDPCAFSAAKLASAKRGVTPDVETYAPDFPGAIDAALRSRTSGDCEKAGAEPGTARATDAAGAAGAPRTAGTPRGSGAGAPAAGVGAPATAVAAAAPAAGAATTPAPAPEVVATGGAADGSVASAASRDAGSTGADDAPFPLVLLAVLAAVAALFGLVWAVARFLAFDPPWLAAGRHATGEAGWRASASWAEFTDWVRLGR